MKVINAIDKRLRVSSWKWVFSGIQDVQKVCFLHPDSHNNNNNNKINTFIDLKYYLEYLSKNIKINKQRLFDAFYYIHIKYELYYNWRHS